MGCLTPIALNKKSFIKKEIIKFAQSLVENITCAHFEYNYLIHCINILQSIHKHTNLHMYVHICMISLKVF